ncbi:MAG: M2 family metallopeptidase [Bacteroidota bacterium]
MKRVYFLAGILLAGIVVFSGCKKKEKDMNKELQEFITQYEGKVIPLFKEASLASWNAEITGKEEDFNKAAELGIKINTIFTNKEDFKKLKEFKESGKVTDSLLLRQLDDLYNSYLSSQADPKKLEEIIREESKVSQKYNTYRAKIGNKEYSDNEIEDILKNSTNSDSLKAAWEASKQIGALVAADVIKLAKLRNEIAKSIGFSNYHEMSLKLGDQDPQEINKIFDELDSLTKDAFATLKGEMDDYFAKRYGIKKEELRPWHYQNRFFQEAPKIYSVNFDTYYANQNLETLTAKYFNGIGLPVEAIMKASDLYEKEGKSQHAFCTHIDGQGDVRILCNIKPNEYWMNTMLHEFGHGVYDKYLDFNLPYSLRNAAHTFTTEAIAMMFGRMATNGQWLKDNVGIKEEEKQKIAEIGFKSLQLQQLTFSRWSQVMYRFEKGMYENPDQDLNKLWWDLVEKYQMLKRPEGRNSADWASKNHIATSPCYYHNYLLGELLASQLHNYIVTNIIKSDDFLNQSYSNNKEVGAYLKTKVFEPGSKYQWNTMIEKATGEKLTAKYYAKQFVSSLKK